jgi:putative inorganic carbon (HCO3(-)) transporter
MSVLTDRSRTALLGPRRTAAVGCVAAVLVVGAAVLVGGPVAALAALVALGVVVALVANVDLAVLTFVAAAPFEGYTKSISGSSVKALGAILFAAWAFAALRRGRVRLGQPVIGWAIALLGVLLASTVWHSNGSLGIEVATRYLSYLAAFVVLIDCMSHRLPPRRVAQVYVAASTVAAGAGLVEFFRGTLRAGGPVGDPNDFAFFLLVALALALGLRRDDRRRYYDVAVIALLCAILATLSRGALVGLAAMLVVGVMTRQVRARVLFATLAVLGAAVLCVMVVNPAKLTTSLHAKGVVAQQNVDDRLLLWKVAGEMTYDHPLLGLGPAGFRENFDRYIDYQQTDTSHQLDVAHETYLEVSSELGLVGLGAFLAIIALGADSARREARRGGPGRGLAGAVWLGTVGAGVAAVFLTEQYYLPLWLLAALGTRLAHGQRARGG